MGGAGKIKKGQNTAGKNFSKNNTFSLPETLSRYGYLIIIFLIVLIYFQTISFDFTHFDDDFLIKNNYENLSDIGKIDDVFLKNSFLSEYNLGFYRPMQTLSYMADALIGGNDAFQYHLTNLIIHCITCCLIFFLFMKLGYSRVLTFFIAVIFSLHPLFVHAVVWLPSRGDLLLGMFCVLSLIFLIKFNENRKWLFYCFHIITFLLAALSKEPAILFPIVLFIWYFYFEQNKILSKTGMALILSWLVVDGIWLIMRLTTVEGTLSSNDFGISPFINNLRTIPEIIGKFIVPLNIQIMPNYNFMNTVIGIIIMLIITTVMFINKNRNNKLLLFGLAWFLVLILPGMLYSRNYADIEHIYDYLDHRNYLPMIGFVIILIESVSYFVSRMNGKKIIGLGVIVILIFSIITLVNSRKYEDSTSYYDSAISENPEISGLYWLRANLKKNSGDINGALSDYNETIRYNPKNADAYNNRGSLNGMLGNNIEALKDFNRAIELNPKIDDGYYNRAVIRNSLGDLNGAIDDYSEVLLQNPKDISALTERGNAFLNSGNYKEAIKDFENVIKLDTNNAEAFLYIGIAKYKLNDFRGGCENWVRAKELGNKTAGQMLDSYCR